MSVRKNLSDLLEQAKARVLAMSPEEYAAMTQAQRESWVRGMTARCEHGWIDFEQCPDCRNHAIAVQETSNGANHD